ncbi:MAG: HNH endonuclease [Planctomycetaceae bacterium]|nr:HNH endonuclease [Planctomycetaceae bacterium]
MKRLTLILILLCCTALSVAADSRYVPQAVKDAVYERDGGKCLCCGTTQRLEYDHIFPYSKGGQETVSNIQLLCRSCNASKSNGAYCRIHQKYLGVKTIPAAEGRINDFPPAKRYPKSINIYPNRRNKKYEHFHRDLEYPEVFRLRSEGS